MKSSLNNMTKILMYHSIKADVSSEVGAELYCVAEHRFNEQIKYLSQFLGSQGNQSIEITFDDGDITNYKYAFVVLKEAGFKAYFFIIVAKIGMPGYMNWEQIKELRDSGMIIGSHGMAHRILTEISDKELNYELRTSKEILEDNLKDSIDYFSLPRGFYNKKIIDKTKEVGYKAVFTSNTEDADGFKFGRIAVKGNWDLEYFIRVVNDGFSLKDKACELIKDSSKKILGAKRYDKIRTRILKKWK